MIVNFVHEFYAKCRTVVRHRGYSYSGSQRQIEWTQCRQGGGGSGDPYAAAIVGRTRNAVVALQAGRKFRRRSLYELESAIRRLRAENAESARTFFAQPEFQPRFLR